MGMYDRAKQDCRHRDRGAWCPRALETVEQCSCKCTATTEPARMPSNMSKREAGIAPPLASDLFYLPRGRPDHRVTLLHAHMREPVIGSFVAASGIAGLTLHNTLRRCFVCWLRRVKQSRPLMRRLRGMMYRLNL